MFPGVNGVAIRAVNHAAAAGDPGTRPGMFPGVNGVAIRAVHHAAAAGDPATRLGMFPGSMEWLLLEIQEQGQECFLGSVERQRVSF